MNVRCAPLALERSVAVAFPASRNWRVERETVVCIRENYSGAPALSNTIFMPFAQKENARNVEINLAPHRRACYFVASNGLNAAADKF